jgi:hypothetical protein
VITSVIQRTRILLFLAAIVVCVLGVSLILSRNCPSAGLAFTRKARTLHQLKNRTRMPQSADFDPQISLNELLASGDDTSRWSTQRAARIDGYVIDVAYARPEAANCFLPCRRDIHILVANRQGAPPNQQVVLEVTPNLREWAARQGWDWSEQTLRAQLLGHWCEFEGWLYFDVGHRDQSENTAPHNPTNWRATAWEIHPITKIRIIR